MLLLFEWLQQQILKKIVRRFWDDFERSLHFLFAYAKKSTNSLWKFLLEQKKVQIRCRIFCSYNRIYKYVVEFLVTTNEVTKYIKWKCKEFSSQKFTLPFCFVIKWNYIENAKKFLQKSPFFQKNTLRSMLQTKKSSI